MHLPSQVDQLFLFRTLSLSFLHLTLRLHCLEPAFHQLLHCRLFLLILGQQFSSRVWLVYYRAFSEHAVLTNLCDWSQINVQLFNFHASVTTACGNRDSFSEPAWAMNSRIICKSWNRGRCVAPVASCQFVHCCSSYDGFHHTTVCPGRASLSSRDFSSERHHTQTLLAHATCPSDAIIAAQNESSPNWFHLMKQQEFPNTRFFIGNFLSTGYSLFFSKCGALSPPTSISLISDSRLTLLLPFQINSNVIVPTSVIISLSIRIQSAEYIIIGIAIVFTIRILPIIVKFFHSHRGSFDFIESIVSLKFNFRLTCGRK